MDIHLRQIGNYILILLLISIVFSCVSTKSLHIEIPQQSKKELPNHIQSLTLVNRCVDKEYTNLKTDSLQKLFYKQNFNIDTVIKDVQSVDTTIKALGDLLFESERYDIVIPEDRFLEFSKNAFFTVEMPWSEVKSLCEVYNTDAVLSIDHFQTKVSTQYIKETVYDSDRDRFATASGAQMKVYYEALIRVYDPAIEKIIFREFLRDTLSWEDVAMSTATLFKHFTPVKDALSEAGIAIALDITDLISTTWNDDKRHYFQKGDNKLKHASELISTGNWESAMQIWKELAENSKSKSTKSKAEFNLAVGYEMDGNLEQAIYWALKSYDTMYRVITYNYLETLQKRKSQQKK